MPIDLATALTLPADPRSAADDPLLENDMGGAPALAGIVARKP